MIWTRRERRLNLAKNTKAKVAQKITAAKNKITAKIGERIRKRIIEDLEYPSLYAFCNEHTSIDRSTLHKIVHGKTNLTIANMIDLAEALEWTLSDLVKDVE